MNHVLLFYYSLSILAYGMATDGLTTYINASTCNSYYNPENRPIIIDIEPR